MAPARGNLERFSGFAGLYDAVRPVPPGEVGALLVAYAATARPAVVDLGSGTGLSSRWAATWAGSVVGVEPNDDMRAVAEGRPVPGVAYREAAAEDTGLPSASADVVLAVQSLHWMDPVPTLAEAARLLRPGGVLAVADCDWPPVAGSARAEQAWVDADRCMGEVERRLVDRDGGPPRARDAGGSVDPSVVGAATTTGPQDRLGDVRKWGKGGHLARMAASRHFAFTREVCLHQRLEGGASRFMALMRSQGTYQQLSRRGFGDEELGMDRMQSEVDAAFAVAPVPLALALTWRVRLGVTPPG